MMLSKKSFSLCITSRLDAKADPSGMASPKIYSSCANCDELHNNQTYFHEYANYPHDKLFFQHLSNQYALQFVLNLNMEEECPIQLFCS